MTEVIALLYQEICYSGVCYKSVPLYYVYSIRTPRTYQVSSIKYSYLLWGTVSHRLFKWHPQMYIHAWLVFVMLNAIMMIPIAPLVSRQVNPVGTRLKPGDVQSLGFVAPNKPDVLSLKVRLHVCIQILYVHEH